MTYRRDPPWRGGNDDARAMLPPWLSHDRDGPALWTAFIIAVLLHVLALLLDLPEIREAVTLPPARHSPIIVKRYIPPPPRLESRRVSTAPKKKSVHLIPVPDPTPDDPEPIREPEPEFAYDAPITDDDFIIGDPVPPPGYATGGGGGAGGPLIPGVGGVTQPIRIDDSYVRPDYPEIARTARIEANVILQAVIHCDGSVGEARVLRCSQPGFDFEGAARDAVLQWRYEPATQDGVPVEVYFTIVVDFDLI